MSATANAQMAASASWYTSQYSTWNRMRRLHAPTFLARADTSAARNAAALRTGSGPNTGNNANDVVINMGDLEVPGAGTNAGKKEIKETLFGPSIGVAGGGPDWCEKDGKDGKSGDDDELTPEIVKDWIRKSKDSSEPTTTLQALVNLKRPTIRLSPLAASSETDPASSDSHLHPHNQQHGLEFEFDCDAPRCSITLHAVGVPAHLAEDHPAHDTDGHASSKDSSEDRLLLFESIVDGGFGKKLHLSDGAILELAKLEHAAYLAIHASEVTSAVAPVSPDSVTPEGESSQVSDVKDHHARKRLTFFRKKGNTSSHSGAQPQSVSQTNQAPTVAAGPALALVDAESHQRPSASSTADAGPGQSGNRDAKDKKHEEEEGGVKLSIRLAACDIDNKALRVRNEQVTYLHIVRHGPVNVPAPVPTNTASSGASEGEGSDAPKASDADKSETGSTSEIEDKRPWVVKVVKREARIGPHAFHLHEIYGLTSHSAAPAHPLAPTAPTPAPEHTYPPTTDASAAEPAAPAIAPTDDADATAECLLCLSSPREVVLLPCRHLVACRECAVNMVEFGAGGTLVHSEPDPPAPAVTAPAAGEGATTNGENPSAAPPGDAAVPSIPAPVPPTPTTRRKRKPKGWFCPVCRQPYTSLLRITTTPPPSKQSEVDVEAKRVSVSSSIEPEHPLADSPTAAPNTNANAPMGGMQTTTTGAFASLTRPGFLRGFSRASAGGNNRDLEAGVTAPSANAA